MMNAPHARTVRGEIVLPPGAPPEAARVVVQLEDVSRADAPSVVVGEQRSEQVRLQGRDRLEFAIEVPADAIDPRAMYSVRAHVDTSGSGTVERGDFVSTQSYPVLTGGAPDEVKIAVRPV
jgi:putative lipoprotein